jgi:hypothetical protein
MKLTALAWLGKAIQSGFRQSLPQPVKLWVAMARVPTRTRDTFFLGAGFSRAVGLPNTAELLTEVHRLAQPQGLLIHQQLRDAYRYFYPEEATTFVPEVVDFFSVLRANEDVSQGMPGAFEHTTLLADLRLVIVRILCDRLRSIDIPAAGWRCVERIVRPGNVVITSNWDLLIEWYASCRGIPLRLGGTLDDTHVTLIKLHGSVDWTDQAHRRGNLSVEDFAVLRELQNGRAIRRIDLGDDDVVRIRAVENMSRSWQFIKARTRRPLMVMMSQGKTADFAPIKGMWGDAYHALSASRHVQLIGYSLPPDDIEIRTLLRAGVSRGTRPARVTIRNPEPSVHIRVRTFVSRTATSDYSAFQPT